MPLLTCPHCGGALPASGAEVPFLRCPTCGATLDATRNATGEEPSLPIREAIVREEDDSATRAVAPERMEPIVAQAATEHMKAHRADIISVEAWSVDETTQAVTGQMQAHRAEKPSAATPPIDETTQAAPDSPHAAHEVTQELPPSAAPVAPPEARLQRPLAGALRALLLMLAALTLVAVVVVASLEANGVINKSETPTPQAVATSTPISSTATPAVAVFSEPGLYRVTYLQGWLIQQRNDPPRTYYALLTSPSGVATVNIEAQQAAGAPAPVFLDEQFLNALCQPGTTLKLDGGPGVVSVGRQEWTQLAANVTLRVDSGQPAHYAHAVALSTQHGEYIYTIVYLAPSASMDAADPAFTTADTTYFQPLLASFTFTG